jgi:hypothetical protein
VTSAANSIEYFMKNPLEKMKKWAETRFLRAVPESAIAQIYGNDSSPAVGRPHACLSLCSGYAAQAQQRQYERFTQCGPASQE